MISWVNGDFGDSIQLEDRGLLYGDGFFTSALLKNGVFLLEAFHIERIEESARKLNIKLDILGLQKELELFLSRMEKTELEKNHFILKILVTRAKQQRGYNWGVNNTASLAFQLFPVSPEQEKGIRQKRNQGLKVGVAGKKLGLNPMLAGIKHLSRLENVMIASSSELEGKDEALVFDLDNRLIEGLSTNIFLASNSSGSLKISTPMLNNAGVEGVMKKYLLLEMKKAGIHVNETQLSLEDALASDAILMCNSVMGTCHVSEIDSHDWAPDNELVLELLSKFQLESISI